jgi:hypothetical protein
MRLEGVATDWTLIWDYEFFIVGLGGEAAQTNNENPPLSRNVVGNK